MRKPTAMSMCASETTTCYLHSRTSPQNKSVNKMNKFSRSSVFAYFYQFACTGRRPSVCLSVSRRSQLPRDSTYIPNYWIIWLKLQIFHCAVYLFVWKMCEISVCERACVCVCACENEWKFKADTASLFLTTTTTTTATHITTTICWNIFDFRLWSLCCFTSVFRLAPRTIVLNVRARSLLSMCVCVCRVFI